MANFSSFFWYNYGIWTPQNCHSDLVECCVIVMGSKVGKKHQKARKAQKAPKAPGGSDGQRLA